MPSSHHRRKHKHPQHHTHIAHARPKAKTKVAFVMALIGAIAGIIVAYIANNQNVLWMIAGSAAGAFIGYMFGNGIDKFVAQKK